MRASETGAPVTAHPSAEPSRLRSKVVPRGNPPLREERGRVLCFSNYWRAEQDWERSI